MKRWGIMTSGNCLILGVHHAAWQNDVLQRVLPDWLDAWPTLKVRDGHKAAADGVLFNRHFVSRLPDGRWCCGSAVVGARHSLRTSRASPSTPA